MNISLKHLLMRFDYVPLLFVFSRLLASRIYFFRISVGEQLRIKATELSKHQLDQHRLFVRPEGPDIIDKPPKGNASKRFLFYKFIFHDIFDKLLSYW